MDLAQIILRMDELKEELDKLRPLSEDRLNRLRQKLKLEWNFHSNSMEGNTLTKSETKSFLLHGITAKGKPFRDYIEIEGHDKALKKLFKIVRRDLKITESLIKEFHKMILVESFYDKNTEINPGKWKTLPNYLYSPKGERIDFLPPKEVPKAMNFLINWLNNHLEPPKRKRKNYNLHPLLIASGFHSEFIRIHPFGDGNGRMGRILMNLILMQFGYVPAVITLEERERYFNSINISSLNEPEQLAIVIGESVIQSLEMAIRAANGESIEDHDFEKELELLNRKLEAKAKAIPLKSMERVLEILDNDLIAFFNKIIAALSKFDHLFGLSEKRLNIDSEKFEIKNSLSRGFWSDSVREQFYKVEVNYNFIELKNLSTENTLRCRFEVEFHRAGYIVSENVSESKEELKYNQSLTEEKQDDWVRKIQRDLLKQINNIVEKD